jgi:hypothetical protein
MTTCVPAMETPVQTPAGENLLLAGMFVPGCAHSAQHAGACVPEAPRVGEAVKGRGWARRRV